VCLSVISLYMQLLPHFDGFGFMVFKNPVYGKVYSIQHYVIRFVSDLRQVSGFLRVSVIKIWGKFTLYYNKKWLPSQTECKRTGWLLWIRNTMNPNPSKCGRSCMYKLMTDRHTWYMDSACIFLTVVIWLIHCMTLHVVIKL
jgi:hypothetical protein